MDFWFCFIFYILGSLSYSLFSRLFNTHHAVRMFRDLQSIILAYLTIIEVDFRNALNLKLDTLKSAGIDENKLKTIAAIDNELLETWKQTIIIKTLLSCPQSMQATKEYKQWGILLNPDAEEEEE